jgi:hypothetical protein
MENQQSSYEIYWTEVEMVPAFLQRLFLIGKTHRRLIAGRGLYTTKKKLLSTKGKDQTRRLWWNVCEKAKIKFAVVNQKSVVIFLCWAIFLAANVFVMGPCPPSLLLDH